MIAITKKNKLKYLLIRLWRQIGYKRNLQIIFLFILMIFTSISEIISIGAVFPFLAALTNPTIIFNNKYLNTIFLFFNIKHESQVLLPLTTIFVVSLVVSGLMRFFLLWVQTKLSFAIGADISFNIFKKFLHQPYESHLMKNSSEVISSISNKANEVTSQVLMPILTIFSSILMILMIFFTMLLINTTVALTACIGLGLIYFLIIAITKNKLSKDSNVINIESGRVIKVLQEGLGNIRDVIIDGSQKIYCDIFKKSDTSLRKAKASITIIGGSPRFGIEALGMSLIAILAYKISKSEQSNFATTAIPILGSMALGAQRMLPILQTAFTSWTFVRGCEASLLDTLNILEQEEDKLNSDLLKNQIDPIKFEKEIKFENVCFSYNNSTKYILKNINLKIKKGDKIGIIGKTGSGKSTFLDILMCLLTPTSGIMKIDDCILDRNTIPAWQMHISHVPQNIYLSDNTIAENIAFGIEKSKIDYNLVKNAAKKAKISDTIESWELNYDTIIGERGVRISGGQRQRIAIARAFYKNADVIILDEATSALDGETEKSVMDSLEEISSDLTLIIVAHRLSTLKNCDYIIKLDNGNIISFNNLDTLNEKL